MEKNNGTIEKCLRGDSESRMQKYIEAKRSNKPCAHCGKALSLSNKIALIGDQFYCSKCTPLMRAKDRYKRSRKIKTVSHFVR